MAVKDLMVRLQNNYNNFEFLQVIKLGAININLIDQGHCSNNVKKIQVGLYLGLMGQLQCNGVTMFS